MDDRSGEVLLTDLQAIGAVKDGQVVLGSYDRLQLHIIPMGQQHLRMIDDLFELKTCSDSKSQHTSE